MVRGSRSLEWAAYAVVCVVWGSTYLAIKVGLQALTPFAFAAFRYWMAAPLMALLASRAGVRFRVGLEHLWPTLGVGVLFIGLCNGMVFWAETRLESSYTALLITASPLWTALLSAWAGSWVPGEGRLGVRGWAGVLVGFAGSFFLLRPQKALPENFTAAGVVELSVIIWAVGSLWARRVRERYHPLEMATWQMVSGAAVLSAIAVLRGERLLHSELSLAAGLSLLYLVIFGSCAAFAAYFFLLRAWPAARVATSAYVNPVVAVTLGWLVLGEWPGPEALLGGVLVLVGVGLVLSSPRSESVRKDSD